MIDRKIANRHFNSASEAIERLRNRTHVMFRLYLKAGCAVVAALLMVLPVYSQKKAAAAKAKHTGAVHATKAAPAQNPVIVNCPSTGQDLISIPEIKGSNGRLRAVVRLTDGLRTMWGSVGDKRCATQYVRYFDGYDPAHPQPWPAGTEPIPGPTLRARVGDTVEVMFLNQINTQHFANSLDQGEQGLTPGCDQVFASTPSADWSGNTKYAAGTRITPTTNNPGGYTFRARQGGTSGATLPNFPQVQRQTVNDGTVIWANAGIGPGQSKQIYPNGGAGGDVMPNCLHGSSTANLHFHGTHTTPNTTGDNVLLFVRPALRENGQIEPGDTFVKSEFAKIFAACEKDGPPTQWSELPLSWRQSQEKLLKLYDTTAPYKGVSGRPGHPALPPSMQLWPQNAMEIKDGLWPQFQIGAYPYCFKLPTYDPASVKMGQAPGTHWYHAHKHGSTALNVANGMTGIFIIEGKYDDDLRRFYGPRLREQVMMLQQLSTAPFPVLDPSLSVAPGAGRAPISINGRLTPVVTMNPGEVQLWRIANGAFRDAVQFQNFTQQGASQPCSKTGSCVDWRQIAQDGVQLNWKNYNSFGSMDNQFNLAPGNRADLLVRAPSRPGLYVLQALANTGIVQDNNTSYRFPLLTVKVIQAPSMGMDFIQKESDFPTFPSFLDDIPEKEIFNSRQIVFAANHRQIDGHTFDPHHINQAVLLNTSEEWKISNQATDKSHPFHIHVNPFQIDAVFAPNSEQASTPGNKCYADPLKPETWDACSALPAPWVWWDTFAIPTTRTDTLVCKQGSSGLACPNTAQGSNCSATQVCTVTYPNNLTRTLACTQDQSGNNVCPNPAGTTAGACSSQQACTVNIPGFFKMRSRFVDYPGQFVLHCHILIHEDRGMMQLVTVCPNTTKYVHQ